MEEQSFDGGDHPVINTALLAGNRDYPERRRDKCARGCSRATRCILTLPFLAIAGLAAISVVCFWNVRKQVGGCVLFGVIVIENLKHKSGLFTPGPEAGCQAVIYGEIAVGVFAVLFAIVLFIKALFNSKMFSWFVLLELFLLCVVFVVSLGISTTMEIGINNTCGSFNDHSPTPDYKDCGTINVNKTSQQVWNSVLQESLVASWLSTLVYLIVVIIWFVLSLFTCCAVHSRQTQAARQRPNADRERMPIIRRPNIYGAT